MRLDKDKQIEDLAKFQRELLSPVELTQMAKKHLLSQGFSPEDLNIDRHRTEE